MDDTRVASHVAVVKVCTINILVSLHNPWVHVAVCCRWVSASVVAVCEVNCPGFQLSTLFL